MCPAGYVAAPSLGLAAPWAVRVGPRSPQGLPLPLSRRGCRVGLLLPLHYRGEGGLVRGTLSLYPLSPQGPSSLGQNGLCGRELRLGASARGKCPAAP